MSVLRQADRQDSGREWPTRSGCRAKQNGLLGCSRPRGMGSESAAPVRPGGDHELDEPEPREAPVGVTAPTRIMRRTAD